LDARLKTLLCKRIIVAKSKEVKAGWSNSQEWTNLTESSKEYYGPKRAVRPMTMTTMMMNDQLQLRPYFLPWRKSPWYPFDIRICSFRDVLDLMVVNGRNKTKLS
jgi:hypothetical protein